MDEVGDVTKSDSVSEVAEGAAEEESEFGEGVFFEVQHEEECDECCGDGEEGVSVGEDAEGRAGVGGDPREGRGEGFGGLVENERGECDGVDGNWGYHRRGKGVGCWGGGCWGC